MCNFRTRGNPIKAFIRTYILREEGREGGREGGPLLTVLAAVEGILLVVRVGGVAVGYHHLREGQPVQDGAEETTFRLGEGRREGGREGGREGEE